MNWLYEITRSIRGNVIVSLKEFSYVAFALFSLLAVFILCSRRMNARLEAAPAPRRLAQLAQALTSKKTKRSDIWFLLMKKMGKPMVWLLRKTDRLLYDKLKLLPDKRTGRRINFFLLMVVVWIAATGQNFLSNDWYKTLLFLRDGWITHGETQTGPAVIWLVFLFPVLRAALCLLPFLLAKKNREFYFDVLAFFCLLLSALGKLLICFPDDCCIGIPYSWGIYNHYLDTIVFPAQLFDAAAGFLAFLFGMLFMMYAKSYRPGRGCSVSLLCFAVPRFYLEYYRYRGGTLRPDEIHGLFGLTMTQTVCVAVCILAVVWWIWLLPLEKKLMDRFWLSVGRRREGIAKSVDKKTWV